MSDIVSILETQGFFYCQNCQHSMSIGIADSWQPARKHDAEYSEFIFQVFAPVCHGCKQKISVPENLWVVYRHPNNVLRTTSKLNLTGLAAASLKHRESFIEYYFRICYITTPRFLWSSMFMNGTNIYPLSLFDGSQAERITIET